MRARPARAPHRTTSPFLSESFRSCARRPAGRPLPGPAPPLSERRALPGLYGTDFRREPHLARLRRRSNGETVSAADGRRESGLGRASDEIGPVWTRQDGAAWSRVAARGARLVRAQIAARNRVPASSPDAASLLRRRLLHAGHARDAQPRHLLPQVSARARWRRKGHVFISLSCPPEEPSLRTRFGGSGEA